MKWPLYWAFRFHTWTCILHFLEFFIRFVVFTVWMYNFACYIYFDSVERSSSHRKQDIFALNHQPNCFSQTYGKELRLNKWLVVSYTVHVPNIPSQHKFSMAVDAKQISPNGPAIIPGLKPGLLIRSRACKKLVTYKDYVWQICSGRNDDMSL